MVIRFMLVALGAIAALVGLAALLFVAVFLFSTRTRAHDAIPTAAAPTGWSYPFSCCSGFDCREIASAPAGAVGYSVPSGEVVEYLDKRIKPSPDGLFHWCSVKGADDGKTICLFVPPPAY